MTLIRWIRALRWAHLISHLSANHFLETLPFPKKEQHFIKKLIHYNGDIQKQRLLFIN